MYKGILKVINDAIIERDSLLDYYRKSQKELEQKIEELKRENEKLKKEASSDVCSR